MDINTLEKSLSDQLEIIGHMEVGSDERLKATREYQTLHDVYVKELKSEADLKTMEDARTIESVKLADSQVRAERERFDSYVDRGIDIAKWVGGLVVTGGIAMLGFEFEKEGAFTSKTVNNIQKKLWDLFRL